ncbi:30S ribosomal protein S20 [Myxococcota bacterium]|nr:30S ribosomal protein S20 [Myxococcota bacterium]MBU1432811.1 30S ribosomal protein S20 [Myxococcota bacterium]MBU1897443.1 30S ribosomal protein S20 [Myxococcota bacterium]
MPNHKSAIKRARQNVKRRARNRHVLTTVRGYVKDVRAAIEQGDAESAQAMLPTAIRALSRAGDKGVLHKNTAQRKIGRLMKAVHHLAPADVETVKA